MDWFEKLTGFREIGYEETRARLTVEGENCALGSMARAMGSASLNHFRDIFPAACCALIMGHEQRYPQKPQCHGVAVSPRVSGEVPSCGY